MIVVSCKIDEVIGFLQRQKAGGVREVKVQKEQPAIQNTTITFTISSDATLWITNKK